MRIFLIVLALFSTGQVGADPQFNLHVINPVNSEAVVAGFSIAQKVLWDDYVSTHSSLSLSQITTFAAVTHALEHTHLYTGQAALEAVSKVTGVEGENPLAPSYKQFNLEVVWKPNAILYFKRSGFTYRFGYGHPGESGISYHSLSHGLHVLYQTQAPTAGHVHVDYRYVFTSGEEGHMKPYNADVRAVGPELYGGELISNYSRHTRWFGKIPNFVR